MNNKNLRKIVAASTLALSLSLTSLVAAQTNPSVVVTLENLMPERGTLLTPVWLGFHDGTFDSYNGGQPASEPLGGNEIESLAEDGNTGPISETFSLLTEGAPQVPGVASPTGPLSPGDKVSVTVNLDPLNNRYFSYASMIIPSNDFFIANGNPLAHQIFDESGEFVGKSFIVSGDESNDAGTEVNDEIARNVAFLNQSAPNTGVDENGSVTSPASGFASPGTLSFPDGILSQPIFGNANFNTPDSRLLKVSFRYVDLGAATVPFLSRLSHRNQIQPDSIDSQGFGIAKVYALSGEELKGVAVARGLSGPLIGASLHLAAKGHNGPAVLDLSEGLRSRSVLFATTGSGLTGPLEGQGLEALLNEMAAGKVYINLSTENYPEGEIRGQVYLR